ncbi:MAG: hypothetical protein MJ162_01050 [Treponema sp.]|nr:hypothetical protein [Treponema sp.]
MLDFYERVKTLCKLNKTTIGAMMNTIYGDVENPISVYNSMKNRDVYPRCDLALKMADYLGVTVEYLVTGNEPAEKKEFTQKYEQFRDLVMEISQLSVTNYNLIKGTVIAMNQN